MNAVDSAGNLQESSDVMDGNVSVLSPGVGVPSYRSTDSREMDLTGGGTSTAAANLSAYLALVMQRWPDATGNQILQSLIRNTTRRAGRNWIRNTSVVSGSWIQASCCRSIRPSTRM